jgi:hypothetical protein
MGQPLTDEERRLIETSIVRLRARVTAVVFAMAGGLGLFVATIWLVIRGGPDVGQHLSLLDNYFPGYEVTWRGSFIGLLYGGGAGALIGWSLASLYNALVRRRDRR